MQSPRRSVRGLRHPEAFHGHGVEHAFFEGWYVKLVSADRAHRWAVIPGIFRGLDGDPGEAFVQVLDGRSGRSWYHRFELDEFDASDRRFDVRVGENRFDEHGVTLALPEVRGRLDYTGGLSGYPRTLRRPGVMGWYAYVPTMECFHGIVSFGHGLDGTLAVDGAELRFDGGRGYIEKDWGRSFPAGYVWMASNHFDSALDASLQASVAIIPWRCRAFRGSIVALRRGRRTLTWATYNRTRERVLEITDRRVRWVLEGPDGVLELEAERVRGGLLHAPLRTAMHRRVEETLDARITVRHIAPDGRVLLDDVGECAGLEVFGDTDRLLALKS